MNENLDDEKMSCLAHGSGYETGGDEVNIMGIIIIKPLKLTFSHAIYEPDWRRQSSFVKFEQYSFSWEPPFVLNCKAQQ